MFDIPIETVLKILKKVGLLLYLDDLKDTGLFDRLHHWIYGLAIAEFSDMFLKAITQGDINELGQLVGKYKRSDYTNNTN